MKRKLFLIGIMMLVPIAAIAGMSAISDTELQAVKGQTGVVVAVDNLTVGISKVAWGDDDGFGTYNTEGWAILSSLDLPTIQFGGFFDVGSDGTDSYLGWNTLGKEIVEGDLTIADVIIGSTATAASPSIGEVQAWGVKVNFYDGTSTIIDPTYGTLPDATIKIGAH